MDESKMIPNMLLRLREGDVSVFPTLVEQYAPMMHRCVYNFFATPADRKEAFSEACVTLYAAALSYDFHQTNVTFGLYARICVFRRMASLFAKTRRVLAEMAPEVDVDRVAVPSGIENALVRDETIKELLAKVRSFASEYEYEVFLSMCVNGRSSAETAEKLGKSVKSVENAKDRLLRRIRQNRQSFLSD
jgi:RNA polymerase sporulation-specific sigma factor